jgi:putative redox protein
VAAGFEVATVTVHGQPTAVGSAGPFTIVVDRPADGDRLQELVEHVDRIAEIPDSLRFGTSVRLGSVRST